MRRYSELGRWFRHERRRRGFHSAAQLCRLAGLSPTYVSDLECGKARPRSATVDRLADAMKLTDVERAEFHRRVKTAGEPATVRDAIAGPPVASLIVWRHLPEPLFQVTHDLPGPAPVNADRMFRDVVPAAAALLGWDALVRAPLPAVMRRQIERLIRDAIRRAKETLPFHVAGAEWLRPDHQVVSAVLPDCWRSLVFRDRRSAGAAARRLGQWVYGTGLTAVGEGWLSFRFVDARVNAQIGVETVESAVITRVHDALVVDHLWDELGLLGKFNAAPTFHHYYLAVSPELRALVDWRPLEFDPVQRAREAPADEHLFAMLLDVEQAISRVRLVYFLRRIAERPRVAEWILGDNWRGELERLTARAVEVESMLVMPSTPVKSPPASDGASKSALPPPERSSTAS